MSEFELDLISTLVAQGESFAEADEEVRGLREAEFDCYDPDDTGLRMVRTDDEMRYE
jgi:hypothetical protein